MDDLAYRLVNAVADAQVAAGKTVFLTALRASIMPPPIDAHVLADVDSTLADLDRRGLLARHNDKGGAIAYALTADGWWASKYRPRAEKVVTDVLGMFRKWVQLGKGDFERISWDDVKEEANVTDAEIHFYQIVCHQIRLTNGYVAPVLDRPGGRLVVFFARPSDLDEIVHLDSAEFLARRQRERREERLLWRMVPKDARTVMLRIYNHLVQHGEWPVTKLLSVELRKIGLRLVDVATQNGDLIWGTNLTDSGERTHLTLRAVALLQEAENDAALITRIVRHLGEEYERDQETLDIPVLAVADAIGLNDRGTLSRLVRMIGAHGAPFTVQGKPNYELEKSTFGTGDRMLDFIASDTIDAVIYVLNEDRRMYGRHVQVPPARVMPDFDVPILNEEGLTELDFRPHGSSSDTGALLAVEPERLSMATPDKSKVFIIHGRNLKAAQEMGNFIRSLGLSPINFKDLRASMGGTPTVAEIVERGMAEAQGVIALFTADEFAGLRPDLRQKHDSGDDTARWQSRPNVIFEAGMAFGRDRNRVVFVLLGNPKLFTDVAGVHVLRPTNDPRGDRATLMNTLANGMKCAVTPHSTDWMSAGDLETCVLPEVSARDPFGELNNPPEA